MKISIIIPVYRDWSHIYALLAGLQSFRQAGHEVIVAACLDESHLTESVATAVDMITTSARGRALQMNAGAARASGSILWFVHADSNLPEDAADLIKLALTDNAAVWGRFDVRLDGTRPIFRVIEAMMNWRSQLTGVVTGDQAMFVRRAAFERLGGYAQVPLMEDVEISKRLRRLSWPVRIKTRLGTSCRRWEEGGVVATILTMWRLRLLYVLGVSPGRLARIYYKKGS